MMGWRTTTRFNGGGGTARVSLVAVAILLLLTPAPAAAEQESPPPAENTTAPPTPRRSEPGFLNALGRWFDDPLGSIGLKDAQGSLNDLSGRAGDTAKDAVDTAKGAADVVVRLPATRIITGRHKCEITSNGAPDCQAAASAVCQSKGFRAGRSVDIESAQKCPARVWLSGRSPAAGECSLETFVTRAICQ